MGGGGSGLLVCEAANGTCSGSLGGGCAGDGGGGLCAARDTASLPPCASCLHTAWDSSNQACELRAREAGRDSGDVITHSGVSCLSLRRTCLSPSRHDEPHSSPADPMNAQYTEENRATVRNGQPDRFMPGRTVVCNFRALADCGSVAQRQFLFPDVSSAQGTYDIYKCKVGQAAAPAVATTDTAAPSSLVPGSGSVGDVVYEEQQYHRTCSVEGPDVPEYGGTQMRCLQRRCKSENVSLLARGLCPGCAGKDVVVIFPEVTQLEAVSIGCPPSHTGSLTRTCDSTGRWGDIAGSCSRRACPRRRFDFLAQLWSGMEPLAGAPLRAWADAGFVAALADGYSVFVDELLEGTNATVPCQSATKILGFNGWHTEVPMEGNLSVMCPPADSLGSTRQAVSHANATDACKIASCPAMHHRVLADNGNGYGNGNGSYIKVWLPLTLGGQELEVSCCTQHTAAGGCT